MDLIERLSSALDNVLLHCVEDIPSEDARTRRLLVQEVERFVKGRNRHCHVEGNGEDLFK